MGAITAGEFAPPGEGPVPFRRDRVPLDVETMASLSRNLELLARASDAKTAADRRGAAQRLALALALNPANTRARELMADYRANHHQPEGDAAKVEGIRDKIQRMIDWLETEEAGSDGRALAACLKDAVRVSTSGNPETGEAPEDGEQGAWTGWVPALSAYREKVIVPTEEPPRTGQGPQKPEKPTIRLTKAQVHTPLWRREGKLEPATWVLAPAPLEMSARRVEGDEEGDPSFAIRIGGDEGSGRFHQVENSLKSLLRKHHESLPGGYRILITSKELEASIRSRKRQSISAAAAVLANSAVTGREPDGVILGQIDETGAFKLPAGFWDQLKALVGKGSGQRLVLPADAATDLPSILAMEKPGFFLEYEVLFAADFKQLLALTAKEPEEPLASASAKFREIREKADTQEVRQYIANGFVKQRLAGVLQDLPSHVSAKMLLVQASGGRPTTVSRPVLAAEIRLALQPMRWIVETPEYSTDSLMTPKVGQTYDACRDAVEGLERYAEKEDRDLLEQGRELVASIRALERASRSRSEEYSVMDFVYSAHRALMQNYTRVVVDLAAAAKDDPSRPSP